MRTLLALWLFALLCPPGLPAQGEAAAAPNTDWLGTEARIAWVGDSITHACRWPRMVENFLLTRFPEKKLEFWNAGVSGDRAGHVLQRLDGDVAAFRPTHAFVMLGMNDGEVQDWDEHYFAIFERDMSDLTFALDKMNARTMLLAPTPFDPIARARYRPGRVVPHYDHVLVRYGEWLARHAAKEGHRFLDTHAPLRSANLALQYGAPKSSLIPDGVHPSELGSAFIALALCEDLLGSGHARQPRAILHLRAGERPESIRLSGAQLEQLKGEGAALRFRARLTTLPWLLIDDCRELYGLSAGYRRLNRALLRIDNLPPGSYWLEVAGHKTLLRTASEWARGVDIGMLRDHPDYFAAAQITALNAARSVRIRKEIRDLWFAKKVIPYYTKTDPEKAARYEKQRRELEGAYEENLAAIRKLRAQMEPLRRPALVDYGIVRHD